jgi:hypothetical protein
MRRSIRTRIAASLVGVLTLTSVVVGAQSRSGGDYLPLGVGNRWELRARNASEPMVLEVTGRDGEAFIVRWINPFIKASFRFVKDGQQIRLTGLDTGQGMGAIPAGAVYWDFALPKGREWKSPIGRGQVSDRGARVETPSGEYRDTVEVRTVDQNGQSMYWTFAPGVGLVRWGQGNDAYLLTSFRAGDQTADQPREAAVPRSVPGDRGWGRPASGPVLIGLDANENDKTGKGKTGKKNALGQAYEAGMTLLHSAPKWDGFEKNGKFKLDDDAEAIGEFANEHNLPIALNLRIIDTVKRSMPKPYEGWRFDDERLADRVRTALRAFPDSYKRHTRFLAIGNEVDGYFNSRQGEIAAYAELMRRVAETARHEFPNAQFTVNFTFGAADQMSRYRAITDLTDFSSFTYYPLNADFTMRDPNDVRRDIERMLEVSNGRRLYIQEIGYASADRLNSSPSKQATFYANAFDAIRAHRNRILGATFLFMSDLSPFVVEYLGLYYMAPNSENFKAYLQTLGILERDGTPKPAFDIFRREASALRSGR